MRRRREYDNLLVKHRRQQSLRDTVHRVVVAFAVVAVMMAAFWLVLRFFGG